MWRSAEKLCSADEDIFFVAALHFHDFTTVGKSSQEGKKNRSHSISSSLTPSLELLSKHILLQLSSLSNLTPSFTLARSLYLLFASLATRFHSFLFA